MGVRKLFELASRADRAGVAVTRAGLIVVLLWIGGLKAFAYEADGIVPFVANSPFMSFFYADPGGYKPHMNPEGALVPENRAWHESNRTYEFAYGLGAVIVLYGLLLCLHPWLPQAAAVGSFFYHPEMSDQGLWITRGALVVVAFLIWLNIALDRKFRSYTITDQRVICR